MEKVTDKCRFQFKKGILFAEFINIEGPLTLEQAKNIVADRLEFCSGASVPVCFRTSQFKYADKSVRDFMNTVGRKGITAGAIITDNAVTRTFFNFFIKITSIDKDIPTRCFTQEDEAIQWLEQYVSDSDLIAS